MRKEIDSLTQPIINIFNAIEADLLISVAMRFDTYDTIGGSLEWQIKKLEELGTLNAETIKVISKYTEKSELEIKKMLELAGYANIDTNILNKAYTLKQIKVDPVALMSSPVIKDIIEQSRIELNKTYRLIQTKAVESTKQAYMDVINRCYIEVSSGIYDYETSIRRGIQKMAAQGITGATYQRNGTTVQYSVESTVRRDTLTAVNQLANRVSLKACEEMGSDYVEISNHLGARVHPTNPIANHAGWQGKVYKIVGSDERYPNLIEKTGYGDIQGLGGVNCRHRMFPFFPGISTPNPIQYDEKENKGVYELTQKQRTLERELRKLKKKKAVAVASDDKATLAKIDGRINDKTKELTEFCRVNNLTRDVSRENISY